ncbi:Hypothetical predicted protein, partial [Marmota monax]
EVTYIHVLKHVRHDLDCSTLPGLEDIHGLQPEPQWQITVRSSPTSPLQSENPPSVTITVICDPGENGKTVQNTFKFTYNGKYPDEVPLYEIFSQENLEDNDVSDILKLLTLEAEENLGIVIIFTPVAAV